MIPAIKKTDGKKAEHFCLDFKWLGFGISDPIQNPDHLQTNLLPMIKNKDKSGFQIPTAHKTHMLGTAEEAWV